MTNTDPASRLSAAALALLAKGGIGAVTVRDVAKAAGTSTTGIYTYFGGKNGLLDALFVEGFDGFREALAGSSGPDPTAVLRDATIRYRSWALANPTRYMLMFASRAAGYEPGTAAGERSQASFTDHVERVRRALEASGSPGDPWTVALHAWSALHGYVMLEIAGPSMQADDPDSFFADGVNRILASHGLIAPSAGRADRV
jgi:AcrR family transcriptional regulator